ncbi:MAG: cobyrinate a,c-diamide synthase [Thiotrichaceae bacterium]
MTLPRIYISAAHKSSGKTTLSLGLCAALTRLGHSIQPLKKGPDYIDPLWLGAASQAICYNLDFNTMSNDEILHMLESKSTGKNMTLIEGNMGLYDGTDLKGTNSNASMAKLTHTPVILVIDAQGVTRGVAPLLLGYASFDPDIHIAGVIFNKVAGDRHEQKLIAVTEHYSDIPVLGCVRRSSDLILVERHLGLMPYNESNKASAKIELIADRVENQVDIEKILLISKQAPELPKYQSSPTLNSTTSATKTATQSDTKTATPSDRITIGICRDESFGFYYADDLEALTSAGAELITINTLRDNELPMIDALFIGGGFPETQMHALSKNTSMRKSIYNAIESGMPVYAECGGLMYLSESISWGEDSCEMVGIIPATTMMADTPKGRGYVELRETDNMKWPNDSSARHIAAHEFHYSRLEDKQGQLTQKGTFAYAVERGYGIDGEHDGWLYKNLLASYSHMRDTSKYHWAKRFVRFIKNTKETKQHDHSY